MYLSKKGTDLFIINFQYQSLYCSQHEITQLQEELNNLKQVPDYQHEETQTDNE